jgi:hypothetical protein
MSIASNARLRRIMPSVLESPRGRERRREQRACVLCCVQCGELAIGGRRESAIIRYQELIRINLCAELSFGELRTMFDVQLRNDSCSLVT